ncbi:MAG: magnesium transporter [Chloroflexi bacterium]|nr:magnesium transporter [Chloroflexota bacterium]
MAAQTPAARTAAEQRRDEHGGHGGSLELGPLQFETAGEHATTNVPIVSPEATAGEIRRMVHQSKYDTVAEIVVCDDGKLAGLINVEDVLTAPEAALARELMDASPPAVHHGMDQEEAAWLAVKHKESSLAVTHSDGTFLGVIPPVRLLQVLLWEHDEDLARLGGFSHDVAAAREAVQEGLARRVWHRVPWLLVGLLGAVLAGLIVGAFETELETRVILAFFVPGVVYLADAVGTQTEALIIRGLSVGVSVRRVIGIEIITGLVVGFILAVVFFPIAAIVWGQLDVAFAVSLSLMAACSIASVVAMVLPWVFHKLGTDPAFGSGPLATVIQDLLTILIYFVIGVNLVTPTLHS